MTSFTISTNSTTGQTLKAGDNGTVNSARTLTTSGVGVTWDLSGTATATVGLANNGTIQSTGGRALDTNSSTPTVAQSLSITNNTGASIIGATDVMRIQKALLGGNLNLLNFGTITAQNGRGFNFQDYDGLKSQIYNSNGGIIQSTDDVIRFSRGTAIAFTGYISIVNLSTMRTTGSGTGQVLDLSDITSLGTGGTVTVNNNATGLMQAANSDAIRGAAGTTINNYGTIEAKLASGTTTNNNAIDFKGNAGGTINNYQGGSIIGAHHGITNSVATGQTTAPGIAISNDGTINGQVGSGINLDTASTTTVTITNGANGTITGYAGTAPTGAASDGDGIDVDGLVVITNSGTIEALGVASGTGALPLPTNEAITVGGGTITNNAAGVIHSVQRAITVDDSNLGNAFAQTTITNHGTITGDNGEAISIHSAFDDVITNDGTITGSVSVTSVTASNGNVSITNSGAIIGAVTTGDGNDTITNSGLISGAVSTGAGTDTIILSQFSERGMIIDGGAGIDTIKIGIVSNTSQLERVALSSVTGVEALQVDAEVIILDTQSYAAGVTIGATGGVVIGINSTSGGLNADVVNNGVIFGNRSDRTELLGTISGSGRVANGLGTTVLGGNNNYSGGSEIIGGTLEIAALHGAGTGSITFDSGAQTLRIASVALDTGNFSDVLVGFATGDTIQVQGHGLSTAKLGAGNILTLTGGSDTVTLHLDQAQNFSAQRFHLSSDGAGGTLVTLAANSAPVSAASTANGTEDTALSGTVSATDADNDGLSYTLGTGPAHGALTFNADGSWNYTPDQNYNGSDSFTWTASDGTASSASATVSISLAAVNDAPVLTGSQTVLAHASEDIGFTVTKAQLVQGFTDVDNDTLSASTLTVDHGSASQNADGSWTIALEENYNGALTLNYSVVDGNGSSVAASLTTTVDAVNDAPIGIDGSITVTEDTPRAFSAADFGFSDVDAGDTLSAVYIDAPSVGRLVYEGNTFPAGGFIPVSEMSKLTYEPPLNANGVALATVTFRVVDSSGSGTRIDETSATLTIHVTPVNDAAALTGTQAVLAHASEDTGFTLTKAQLLQGFTDAEGDTLSIGTLALEHGSASQNSDGSWTVTLDANYNGALKVFYSVVDGNGGSVAASLTATVDAVNDAPIGIDGSITVTEDTPRAFSAADFGFSDIDTGDTLSAVYIDAPSVGRLVYEGNTFPAGGFIPVSEMSKLTYEPPLNANGNALATVTFRVVDSSGSGTRIDETSATLTIHVTPVNDAPVIVSNTGGASAAVSIAENSTAVTTVHATDPDAGATLAYAISGGADAAKFQIDATTGALSFKAAPNFEAATDAGANNVYDVIVSASDGLLSDTQAIAVTVTDVSEYTAITGTAAKDTLTGTGGADRMFGLDSNDTLTGLAGDDVLDGGSGSDKLIGGLGDDTYIVDVSGDKVIEVAGEGTDTIQTTLVKYTLGKTIENLTFTDGAAHIGTGNALENHLIGGSGADVLNGKAGADVLEGGLGNDSYFVDDSGDTVIEVASGGTDSVTATVSFVLSAEVENLTLKSGKLALDLTGNAGANDLIGNSNANVIAGLGGDDTLIGGKGNDMLTGGSGADSFVFDTRANTKANLDTVTDFVSGTDTVVFDRTVYTAFSATGAIEAGAFHSGTGINAAHDGDDRFIYNTATGALWYDADGTGASKAIEVVVLGEQPALAFSDILIAA